MAKYNYSFQGYDAEKMAKAVGRDITISTKHAIEICNFIRKKPVEKAKIMLNDAIEMKRPIPFKRFTNGPGHKAGMASGRFCVNACEAILRIVESAEINAQHKGLNTSNLALLHISAQQAAKIMKHSRHRGRAAKNTHVEVVVGEHKEISKEDKADKKKEPAGKEAKGHINKDSMKHGHTAHEHTAHEHTTGIDATNQTKNQLKNQKIN